MPLMVIFILKNIVQLFITSELYAVCQQNSFPVI